MAEGPVHYLENVPGEPGMVRTACREFKWRTFNNQPYDDSKSLPHSVTYPKCLEAMVDRPVIVNDQPE